MWKNILVASSNWTCVYPILTAIRKGDYWSAGAVSFVSVFSILSHLVENHKHGMVGITGPFGTGSRACAVSYYLNRMDVIGCGLVAMRLGYVYYHKYGFSMLPILNNKLILLYCAALIVCNFISEYDKFNPALQHSYIFFHCIWHVGIFILMNSFMDNILY